MLLEISRLVICEDGYKTMAYWHNVAVIADEGADLQVD